MKNKLIKDEKQLYSKMFLYKTFFYRWINFTTESTNEEVINIINALNIKNRFKRVEFIYDYCCKKLDSFYEGKNICEFKDNKCIVQQGPNCKFCNGCCRLCRFQTTSGCQTSNLSCKLFYCDTIQNKHTTIKYKDLKILKLLSLRQKMIVNDNFFAHRKEFLLELKVNSITFWAVRMLIRIVKNAIYCRKLKKEDFHEKREV